MNEEDGSAVRRWLFRAVGVALGLVMAELAARLVLASPTVTRRLHGPHALFVNAMAEFGSRRGQTRVDWTESQHPITPDPAFGWVNKPGVFDDAGSTITISAQRLRALRNYTLDVPQGKTRVLVLGDSFAFGASVNDADVFSAQLEERDGSLEVLNFGVPGYGLDQALLLFQAEGVRYHPDIVVVNVVSVLESRERASFTSWLKPYFTVSDGRFVLHGVPVPSPWEAYERYLKSSRLLDVASLVADAWFTGQDQIPDAQRPLLDRLVTLVRQSGARPVLVFAPSGDDYGNTGGSRMAEEPCTDSDVACIDTTPEFARASESGVDLWNMKHWNAAGHRIVAEALAVRLRRLRDADPRLRVR